MNAQTLVPAAGSSFAPMRRPDASLFDMAMTEFHAFAEAFTASPAPAPAPAVERYDHTPSYAPTLDLPAPVLVPGRRH